MQVEIFVPEYSRPLPVFKKGYLFNSIQYILKIFPGSQVYVFS